jgi:hypothetical protein
MATYDKRRSPVVLLVLFALVWVLVGTQPAGAQSQDWREEYAYTLGVQAYIYGFPWVYLSQIRWQWAGQAACGGGNAPCAPLNEFSHARGLNSAADKTGGSPNNDTVYSIAWVDLSAEPVILSVPAIPDRYYTFEMSSMDSDNFAYVGTRATDTQAGDYAIVGPGWTGELPSGVIELPRSRTAFALILGRTLVYGEDDLANVHALQDQYKLTPLSRWGVAATETTPHYAWAPFAATDPLAAWKTMNRAMTENPPNVPEQQELVNLFAAIGVGPGQDLEAVDNATKRGLERAAAEAMVIMHGFNLAGGGGREVNGWTCPPATLGRAGQHGDFLVRAASQCWAGIVANDAEEAIYLNTSTDAEGEKLTGANDYEIHFLPGGLPDVGAFWSITMYGYDHNLVENPLDRYKLGTYPEGLMRLDPDGGLTIYVQHETPGPVNESNWLPAPEGDFYLILRTYLPGVGILEGTWAPPAVVLVAR